MSQQYLSLPWKTLNSCAIVQSGHAVETQFMEGKRGKGFVFSSAKTKMYKEKNNNARSKYWQLLSKSSSILN